MGLFTRKHASAEETTSSEATASRKHKAFRIELGWRGMFSLILVCCCLFLWMFLLGLWAGQTILFPQRESRMGASAAMGQNALAPMTQQTAPPR